MITAIALQIVTGILRQRALEGKYSNFSLFHRVSDLQMSNDSPVFQDSLLLHLLKVCMVRASAEKYLQRLR